MNVLLRIAGLEWRMWSRDLTARVAVALLGVTTAYAVANGLAWMSFVGRANADAGAENRRVFASLQEGADRLARSGREPGTFDVPASPGMVGLFSPRYAGLVPTRLAFVSVGQSDVTPYYFRVTSERLDSFIDAEEVENPLNLLNGRFDVAYLLVMIVPLVLLAATLNVVASDREQGRLALVLAQPFPLGRLIAVRVILRALTFASVLGLVTGAGAIIAGAGTNGRDVGLLAVVAAGLVLTVLLWLAVGAAVSAVSRSTAVNAVAALSLWLVLSAGIPTAVQVAAQAWYPVPPRIGLIERTRALDTEVRTQVVELLETYYRTHPDARPAGLDTSVYNFPLYWTAIQSEVDRRMAPVVAEYDAAVGRQQAFVTRVSWLSPVLLVQELLNDAAGTGVARHQQFMTQVREFHQAHRAFFEPRTYRFQFLSAADYDRMPRFAFREEPWETLGRRLARQLALLIAWCAVALFACSRAAAAARSL